MPNLSRRDFIASTVTVAAGAAMLHTDTSLASGLFVSGASGSAYADQGLKPMSVGLLISPADGPMTMWVNSSTFMPASGKSSGCIATPLIHAPDPASRPMRAPGRICYSIITYVPGMKR